MPTVGQPYLNPLNGTDTSKGYASRFNHRNETAQPGYYSVKLDDENILTPGIDVVQIRQRIGRIEFTGLGQARDDRRLAGECEVNLRRRRCDKAVAGDAFPADHAFEQKRVRVPAEDFKSRDGGEMIAEQLAVDRHDVRRPRRLGKSRKIRKVSPHSQPIVRTEAAG